MKMQPMWTMVAALAALALLAGLAGGLPAARPAAAGLTLVAADTAPAEPHGPAEASANVASTITYQGRLSSPSGDPLSGTYNMQFRLYDAAAGGSLLFDSGLLGIQVIGGDFNVALNVSQAHFNGQGLWLSLTVNGETLSPRQALHPAPYALGLRPGALIAGDPPAASSAVLAAQLFSGWPSGSAVSGLAPSTGTALYGLAAGGVGLSAHSNSNIGVSGTSNLGTGGYFASQSGYGIRVSTTGTAHYDHGAVISSTAGFGVLAISAQNQAVRGQAGNITGIAQPLGAVGVVGIGQNRGTYGSSGSGVGLYGVSTSNYGVWGQSATWRGVTGRTDRADNNYGLYTPDNLFALNVNLAGAQMNVVQNGGATALEPGDVVVFSGMSKPLPGDGTRVPQVSQATLANSTAVAGVVYSRFDIATLEVDENGVDPPAAVEVTPAGAVAPGEYMLLVVQGPAQVKASALGGPIAPGDLLSTGAGAGLAGRSESVTLQGVEMSLPGTVFGKALEALPAGQGLIYIWVSLQ